MLLYAITDRHVFPGGQREQVDALFAQLQRLAARHVDYLQLREKDLPEQDLEQLARRLVSCARGLGSGLGSGQSAPRILINGPARIAVASAADGLHLRGGAGPEDLAQARGAFQLAGLPPPIVSISCHSVQEAAAAASAGFDCILLGPIFEKRVRGDLVAAGLGLARLREAAQLTPASRLLALGGVTAANAPDCVAAGASGIAGIRMFL